MSSQFNFVLITKSLLFKEKASLEAVPRPILYLASPWLNVVQGFVVVCGLAMVSDLIRVPGLSAVSDLAVVFSLVVVP